MDGWLSWTVRHPFVFWLILLGISITLAVALPVGQLFITSAITSGILWQFRANTQPKPEKSSRRSARIAESRRRSRVLALPPLRMPPGPHILLPRGQKIQVTKEEHHVEHVGALLAEEERHVAATLHRLSPLTPRSTKERVEVRIDGNPVGELTVYMSGHFLPLIRACDGRDVAVVCAALVKGNQLKVDVVLDAAKAIDLDDAWIDEHINVEPECGGPPRDESREGPL